MEEHQRAARSSQETQQDSARAEEHSPQSRSIPVGRQLSAVLRGRDGMLALPESILSELSTRVGNQCLTALLRGGGGLAQICPGACLGPWGEAELPEEVNEIQTDEPWTERYAGWRESPGGRPPGSRYHGIRSGGG